MTSRTYNHSIGKCLFFLLNLVSITGLAQSDVLRTVQNDHQKYVAGTVKEKMFVHTDKAFYLAGELVWFKLYNVEEATHQPARLSKVGYVEILNAEKKPVVQAKVELKEGEGSGSFYLPFSLPSGAYTFRAYTNWLKNFGADYFFEKGITIVNTLNQASLPPAEAAADYQVSFFPEGGQLVAGLAGRVGFKITDQKGKGTFAQGVVVNSRKDTVASLETHKFGLGNFVFQPEAGQQYTALITLADGRKLTKLLPPAAPTGYAMQVTDNGQNTIRVTVRKHAEASNQYIYLVASNRQQIKVAERGIWQNNTAIFEFAKQTLGEGISSLTVFNENKQPISERMFFIPPSRPLPIQAQNDATVYGPRQKAAVTFSVADTAKAAASLSMAVYLIDSVQAPDEVNIVHYLWLTSELQGYVESPEYYLAEKGPEAAIAIDNLMLTHGWRRFNWDKEAMAGKQPAFQFVPEFSGHIVSGQVHATLQGRPVAGIPAFLSVPGRASKFYTTESTENGQVHFTLKDYYGPGEVVVQTNTAVDSFYRIDILSPFSEQYTNTVTRPFTITAAQAADLAKNSIGTQVQNIFVSDSLARFYMPATDSTPFYGQAPNRYMLDDYTRFTTMEEVLREYVREINVRRRGGQPQLIIYNEPKKTFFEENSLVLLDGIPVFRQEKIFAYNPAGVQKLEVFPQRYFIGNQAFNGIANFTTYKGISEGLSLDPQAVIMDYEGLQQQRQFYAPEYHTPEQAGSRIPDFRSVLYWAPDIVYNGNGTQTVNFFTSDRKGRYLVVLQGMNAQGRAGATSLEFDVK